MITDDKLFIGEEVEGVDQGIRTLFVPFNADLTFIPAILEQTGITRVYFGAGGSGKIHDFRTVENQRILQEIFGNGASVVFEVSDVKEIKKIPVYFRRKDSVAIVLTIPLDLIDGNAAAITDITDIKLVSSNRVYWIPNLESLEVTSVTDDRYATDREVNLHELGIK